MLIVIVFDVIKDTRGYIRCTSVSTEHIQENIFSIFKHVIFKSNYQYMTEPL